MILLMLGIGFAVSFAFAARGRSRWPLYATLAVPILLLAFMVAAIAWTALAPCNPPEHMTDAGYCWFWLGMGSSIAVFVGLSWIAASLAGWLVGWLLRATLARR